jgi:polar amino acid transport system substrate-binding protein
MKRQFFTLLFVCSLTTVIAEDNTVSVVADPWCPFNCDASTDRLGVMIDMAKHAYAYSGITLDYRNVNWARAGRLVMEGADQAIVGMGKSANTMAKFHFPKIPMAFSQVCFYRKKGVDWTFENVDSLKDQQLGWINKYKFGDEAIDAWVQAGLKTGSVFPITGESELIFSLVKMLEADRITTFGEVRSNVEYASNSLVRIPDIEIAGCLDSIDDIYIAFTPGEPSSIHYAQKLDEGLEVLLKDTEKMEAIFSNYGIDLETYYLQLQQYQESSE